MREGFGSSELTKGLGKDNNPGTDRRRRLAGARHQTGHAVQPVIVGQDPNCDCRHGWREEHWRALPQGRHSPEFESPVVNGGLGGRHQAS